MLSRSPPNTESVIRLVGDLLVEVNDEMISSGLRYITAGFLTFIADQQEDQIAHSQQHPAPEHPGNRTTELHPPRGTRSEIGSCLRKMVRRLGA